MKGLAASQSLADAPILVGSAMASEFRWFIPVLPKIPEEIQRQHTTREFYREVVYREEREHYYQWYRETAERHRCELEKMRGDINLMRWFSRR